MTKKNIATSLIGDWLNQHLFISKAMTTRFFNSLNHQKSFIESQKQSLSAIAKAMSDKQQNFDLSESFVTYLTDRAQRSWLTLDVLSQAANKTKEHHERGGLPFLIYDFEVILEGKNLSRPSNYCLLKIIPPADKKVLNKKRPYIIIDPRAGHGPGIGGFKEDSQVGVALNDGHPVYFIAFTQKPQPEQSIADVTACEAKFVQEVIRLHPSSPNPIIVGNCQGGWATAILAATHPEITGPIVLNGAPMAYWSGKLGQDPMRYAGGIMGGVLPAMISADLNKGEFDGANLVLNFEGQNPARTWLTKYYDLFCSIDSSADKFIEFEKWWSTFYFMTDKEIQWIVENLFIGNRLSRNKAELETGVTIDLRAIKSPIIVFASHGDNITPPGQALNWIIDAYKSEKEIELAGQRIIYLVHENVGHLGIFVSSQVARKEHQNFVSTLKTIEAFPAGLYRMEIETIEGTGETARFDVSFHPSSMAEIELITGKRADEAAFAGVAKCSEENAKLYEKTLRPFIKTMGKITNTNLQQKLHPSRIMRTIYSSVMPTNVQTEQLINKIKLQRKQTEPNNPFVLSESLLVDSSAFAIDNMVNIKEAMTEFAFFSIWANPFSVGLSRATDALSENESESAFSDIVLYAVSNPYAGGAVAAYMRILLLIFKTRSSLKLDQMTRCANLLSSKAPFKDLDAQERNDMLLQQKILVDLDIDTAISSLSVLLPTQREKQRALDILNYLVREEDVSNVSMKGKWQEILEILNQSASESTRKSA